MKKLILITASIVFSAASMAIEKDTTKITIREKVILIIDESGDSGMKMGMR